MKVNLRWNNLAVFFVSVAVSLVITPFVEPLYKETFYSGSGFSSFIIPSYFDTYPPTFFLLYALSITFFYRAFAKNFKPVSLGYFLILPFLLFISSMPHIISFFSLCFGGLILGHVVSKIFPKQNF